MNGNVECFTGGHIPLALLAIAVLVITALLVPLVGLVSMKQHLIKVNQDLSEPVVYSYYVVHHVTQSLYWLKYAEDPLTAIYKEDWRWWSVVDLARRLIFILFVILFPRNSVSSLSSL